MLHACDIKQFSRIHVAEMFYMHAQSLTHIYMDGEFKTGFTFLSEITHSIIAVTTLETRRSSMLEPHCPNAIDLIRIELEFPRHSSYDEEEDEYESNIDILETQLDDCMSSMANEW